MGKAVDISCETCASENEVGRKRGGHGTAPAYVGSSALRIIRLGCSIEEVLVRRDLQSRCNMRQSFASPMEMKVVVMKGGVVVARQKRKPRMKIASVKTEGDRR
jgi:hypothetical protein